MTQLHTLPPPYPPLALRVSVLVALTGSHALPPPSPPLALRVSVREQFRVALLHGVRETSPGV